MTSCEVQPPPSASPHLEESKTAADAPSYSLFYEGEPISEVVRSMLQDRQGRFWLGTQDGAFVYSGDSSQKLQQLKKNVTIKDMAEDQEGNIWLAHTRGISKVEGENVTHFGRADGLISEDTWCITADSQGNVWIGTFDGLCKYDGKHFTHISLPEGQRDTTVAISGPQMINDLLVDQNNHLWISSTAGLFRFNGQKMEDMSERLHIAKHFVTSLFEDPEGVLWVGSHQGLYRVKDEKATNITEGVLTMEKGIGAVARDAQGVLWIVVNQHQWVTYDGEQFTPFPNETIEAKPVVFQWFLDQSSRWWMVGYGGAYRLEKGELVHVSTHGPW